MPISVRNAFCAAVVASCALLASTAALPEHERAHEQNTFVRSEKHSRRSRSAPNTDLVKRGPTYSGRATYYVAGLGACGNYNSGSDFIVALNAAQYGDMGQVSSWCGKTIAITHNGNTQYATVADACPSCPYGGLDMSSGLFSAFTSLGTGVFQMTWTLADGSGGSSNNDGNSNNNNNNHNNNNNNDNHQKTSTYSPPAWTWKPEPTTTSWSQPAWTPTTTWTPEPWTSSSSSSSTRTTRSSTSTSTSTTSSASSTASSASSSSSKSGSSSRKHAGDNLSNFALIYQGLNHMAVAAAN